MLVTFTCEAYADITMFGDVAKYMLTMMGHSGSVPGALLADDVPAALERLTTAIEAEQDLPAGDTASDDEDDEEKVSLTHRALPLIELLQAAAREHVNVMWNRG